MPIARTLPCFFFFFNDTATTEIYTLSLHDALPISPPLPLAQRIAFLQHHVTRLVTNGVLNDGQGNALNVKLEGALRKLADGETEPAMNKLGAFINQVEAFRAAGILSETQSASLLEIARDVVMRAARNAST